MPLLLHYICHRRGGFLTLPKPYKTKGENECSKKTICHPERNEMKSRDLRTTDTVKRKTGAKIPRLALLPRDDILVDCLRLLRNVRPGKVEGGLETRPYGVAGNFLS